MMYPHAPPPHKMELKDEETDLDLRMVINGTPSEGPSNRFPIKYNNKTPFDAARAADLPTLAMFRLSGFDLNTCEEAGPDQPSWAVLHIAACHDFVFIANYLLQCGVDFELPARKVSKKKDDEDEENRGYDGTGETPLMIAVANFSMNVVKILLERGADPNRMDLSGANCAFYSCASAVRLHFLACRGLNLKQPIDNGETILHFMAKRGFYYPALYLFEKANWEDVDVQDDHGRTPLHIAAQTRQFEMAKLLVSKGADIQKKTHDGLTPVQMASGKVRRLLLKLKKEYDRFPASSAATDLTRSSLLKPDLVPPIRMNFKQFLNAFGAFMVPNILLLIAARLWFPFMMLMMILVAFALFTVTSQKKGTKRNFGTTGFYMGGLIFGSSMLISHIWPVVKEGDENGATLMTIWACVTTAMLGCYFRVLLGDPGVLPPNKDHREELYKLAEQGAFLQIQQAYYPDAMIRKPNRSKYCTDTDTCVARFDHYCVWLGNAVGFKNHIYFCGFGVCQFISQTLVFILLLKYYRISRQNAEATGNGVCDYIDFMFSPEHTTVSTFLGIYAWFPYLFITLTCISQIALISRNTLSNEKWFSARYPWMMQLRGNVISLYDQGCLRNWMDFFRPSSHENDFGPPPMNDYCRKFLEKYKGKGTPAMGGGGCQNCSHGHAHGPAGGGEVSAGADASHQHHHAHHPFFPGPGGAVPMPPMGPADFSPVGIQQVMRPYGGSDEADDDDDGIPEPQGAAATGPGAPGVLPLFGPGGAAIPAEQAQQFQAQMRAAAAFHQHRMMVQQQQQLLQQGAGATTTTTGSTSTSSTTPALPGGFPFGAMGHMPPEHAQQMQQQIHQHMQWFHSLPPEQQQQHYAQSMQKMMAAMASRQGRGGGQEGPGGAGQASSSSTSSATSSGSPSMGTGVGPSLGASPSVSPPPFPTASPHHLPPEFGPAARGSGGIGLGGVGASARKKD